MSDSLSYKEMYTNAYCRLSFEIWHPGYKDDISKYLSDDSQLDKVLDIAAKEIKDTNIIKIDGTQCLNKFNLKSCVETFLKFLYWNESFELIVGLPYEELKKADAISYEYTNFWIDETKFADEMREKNFVLIVWNIAYKSRRYMKVLPDKKVIYAIDNSNNNDMIRGDFAIEAWLYEQLIHWSKKIIDKNKNYVVREGGEGSYMARFHVDFNYEELGFDKDGRNYSGIAFNETEGHGPMSLLLSKPELKEFVEVDDIW